MNGSQDDALVYFAENESLVTAVREGDPVPDLNGVSLHELGGSRINSDGTMIFHSTLTSGNSGVFSGNGWIVEAIALTGEPAPGVGSGTNFQEFEDTLTLNNSGSVAFSAELSSGVEALFANSTSGSALQLLALGGEDAPGIPLNPDFKSFRSVAINDNHETASLPTLMDRSR